MNAIETAEAVPESYLRRVFLIQYNLILLGGSVLFSLASASPLPLLAGLVLEVAYLGIASNLGAMRRYLDGRDAKEPVAESEPAPAPAADPVPVAVPVPAPVPVPDPLDPAYAKRLAIFEQTAREMRDLAGTLDAASQRHLNAGLEAVVRSFARLCESHQRLSTYLAATPEAAISEEIARLKREFSAEKDLGLRLAIRQSIGLAQRRLEQRTQLETSLRTTNIRLVTLERAALSLRAQARAAGLSRQVLAEVDVLRREAATDLDDDATPSP
jgi:hypothetical protein